jgi:glycine reductase
MRLELWTYEVSDVRLGARTRLDDRVLEIDARELRELLCRDPVIADVRVELARPDEPVRIIHILDSIEPRARMAAPGADFPGVLSPPLTVGEGRTHRLSGVAVTTTALLPLSLGGLNVKEAIVDMTGPAAPLTPFSRTLNVVLIFAVREGGDYAQYDEAIRKAGLRAAVYLAEATAGLAPDRHESFELTAVDPSLPRVAYICLLKQEGDVQHMFVYGRTIDETPSLMHPNEFLDGAITSGDHGISSYRNPTYVQQNNPVIEQLYRRHGRELAFAGVVIAKCMSWSHWDKQRSASYAAKLARLLGAEAVVITGGGGGHAVADLMLNCQESERQGLATALTCFELSGETGAELGFVTFVPEADAVISTGNIDEVIELPPMERVLGGDAIVDIGNYEGGNGTPAIERFSTALRRIYCCAGLVGAGRLTARTV